MQDVEHTGTKRIWNATDGRTARIWRAATIRKHTGSTTIIGTCVTRVVLMCHGDTQARQAYKHAAGLNIRKIVTGESTRATRKQDTMFASKRKTHISCPPTRGHTKLDK